MTIYLTFALVVVGVLLMCQCAKPAMVFAGISIFGCFGYRLYIGEEFRAVSADALFCVALIPIGWYVAKAFDKLFDAAADKKHG